MWQRGGYSVIPVGADKKPLIKWGEFQTRLPTDEEIDAWFRDWPDCNVGVVTGGASRLAVVDADDEDAIAWVNEMLPDATEIPTVKTPRGQHWYVRIPEDVELKSGSKFGGKKLDIRADGGFIVAPPSRGVNGKVYEWILDWDGVSVLPALSGPLLDLFRNQRSAEGSQPVGGALEKIRAGVGEGDRNSSLHRLGIKLASTGYTGDEIESVLLAHNPKSCHPPLDPLEVREIAKSASMSDVAKKAKPANGHGEPVLIRMSDVRPESVRWLWPGRVPFGKLTILDGDPGLGKSLLSYFLAAVVTNKAPLPDGTTSDLDGPAGVVLLSAEDDPADTIRPRLDAAGADSNRVVLLSQIREVSTAGEPKDRLPSLADIVSMRVAIIDNGAKLVIVDPIMAYIDVDAHVDADVRRRLAPLSALAAETGAAVVCIRHLNKSAGGNVLYRGGGSIGIIGAARSGLLVGRDPDDPTGTRRILATTKCNLSSPASALAFRVLLNDAGAPAIHWDGQTDHTPQQLLGPGIDGSEGAEGEARAFLKDLLATGPVSAKEVLKAGRDAGIAEPTLRRAKEALRIRSEKIGRPGQPGSHWEWMLPTGPDSLNREEGTEGGEHDQE